MFHEGFTDAEHDRVRRVHCRRQIGFCERLKRKDYGCGIDAVAIANSDTDRDADVLSIFLQPPVRRRQ